MIELRYEILRMKYMRIVWVLFGVAAGTGAAMAIALMAMTKDSYSLAEFVRTATSAVAVSMTRGPFAVSISVLLGILVASRDLRRGRSGTTPVLLPCRGRLFSARLAVIGLGAALVAAVTVAFSATASLSMLPEGASVDAAAVARVAGMFVAAQACWAIIGAALALLTGSAGVAAAIAFGWILVVEPSVRLALVARGDLAVVIEYLPVSAANIMVHSLAEGAVMHESVLLSATPATAAISLVGVVSALVVWAWTRFRTRSFAHA